MIAAGAMLLVGLTAGAVLRSPAGEAAAAQPAPVSVAAPAVAAASARSTEAPVMRAVHPAEVLRVFDGDTFEARVHLWPGLDVTTRVRLRNLDTPEMKARCEAERRLALAARDALQRMLDQGAVGVTRVTLDKYGGRVVADVSTHGTPDVSAAMVAAGLGRRYGGGRREGWCL